MLTVLFWLALYTVIVLIFVDLNKIGKAQDKVRAQWKKLVDKVNK